MEKINLDDNSRYVKRLHSRVMRKRRIQLVLFTVVAAAVLVWVSVGVFNTLKHFRMPPFKFGQTMPVKKKKAAKRTFVIIGVDQRDYEQYVSGATLLVYDPVEKTASGLAFKKDIRLQIPGYGLDTLEKSLFAGLDSALASITNVTGIKADKYIMVDSGDYGVAKPTIQKIFTRVLKSNLSEKEQLAMVKKFKALDASDINVLEAPTKKVSIGAQPYEQLKKQELNRLIRVLWDLQKPLKRTKVIVLNGVGTGGLAGKVALKLIKGGYEVIDVKNANGFNYKKTLIITYSQAMQKKALAMQKLLGYGNIMLELDKQGLTDMTVIVGKDYKKF